jgi:hypothetical protein
MFVFCAASAPGVTTTFNAAAGGGTFNWSSATTWVENPATPDGDDDMNFNVSGKVIVYDAAAVETGGGFGANRIGTGASVGGIRLATLRLGKDLKVSQNVRVIRDGTLDLNGKTLTVGTELWFGDSIGDGTLVRNGGTLSVGGQINVDDNGTASVILAGGDTLASLRARLSTGIAVTGNVTVGDGVGAGDDSITLLRNALITLEAGSKLNAKNATMGDSSGFGNIQGKSGSTLSLSGNQTFGNNSSQFIMSQALDDQLGLTLEVAGTNQLNTGTGARIALTFDENTVGGALAGDPSSFDWAFRWLGDHEAFLESVVGSRLIVNTGAAAVTFNAADNIFLANDGYTYVGFAVAVEGVPEPSTYALGLIGLTGLGLVAWRKRRTHG